jgi:hypothetical protein
MKKILICTIATLVFFGCGKTKAKTEHEAIFAKVKSLEGYVFYKNSSELLLKGNGSGHSNPKLATRYNSIAATMLNTEGKVIEGSVFPQGSLIVKDLYDVNDKFDRYSIMYKDSTSKYKDERGWVWAEFKPNGKARYSIHKIGKACISCHNQAGNIEYSLMQKVHP